MNDVCASTARRINPSLTRESCGGCGCLAVLDGQVTAAETEGRAGRGVERGEGRGRQERKGAGRMGEPRAELRAYGQAYSRLLSLHCNGLAALALPRGVYCAKADIVLDRRGVPSGSFVLCCPRCPHVHLSYLLTCPLPLRTLVFPVSSALQHHLSANSLISISPWCRCSGQARRWTTARVHTQVR